MLTFKVEELGSWKPQSMYMEHPSTTVPMAQVQLLVMPIFRPLFQVLSPSSVSAVEKAMDFISAPLVFW